MASLSNCHLELVVWDGNLVKSKFVVGLGSFLMCAISSDFVNLQKRHSRSFKCIVIIRKQRNVLCKTLICIDLLYCNVDYIYVFIQLTKLLRSNKSTQTKALCLLVLHRT